MAHPADGDESLPLAVSFFTRDDSTPKSSGQNLMDVNRGHGATVPLYFAKRVLAQELAYEFPATTFTSVQVGHALRPPAKWLSPLQGCSVAEAGFTFERGSLHCELPRDVRESVR